jgi:hypothetical protein
MTRLARRALILVSICCSALTGAAQNRPDFCEPVPDALLGGMQAPYGRQVAPNGNVYCEGLLRRPIALAPTSIVSVKQDQAGNSLFEPNKIASLTWCDDSPQPVHVQLRSLKSPMFALDAMNKVKFDWRTDLIARWQPNWTDIAALGIRQATIGGQTYKLVVPRRSCAGYSVSYSFMVQSKTPILLTTALIEPIEPSNPLETVKRLWVRLVRSPLDTSANPR